MARTKQRRAVSNLGGRNAILSYECWTARRVAELCRAQDRCAAAAAAAPVLPVAGMEALPEDVTARVFQAVSVKERLKLSCVCRSWAAYLRRPKLWQTLDLSPAGGVTRASVSSKVLLEAAARACGALHTLDVSDCLPHLHEEPAADEQHELPGFVSVNSVEAVLAANARTMRVVRAHFGETLCDSAAPAVAGLRPPQLFRMLRAAPLLDALHTDVACVPFQAAELVARRGTAAPLRIRRLVLRRVPFYDSCVDRELLASLGTHPSLCELVLDHGLHLQDDKDDECIVALVSCTNVTAIGLAVGFETLAESTLVELLLKLFPPSNGPLRSLRLFNCDYLAKPVQARNSRELHDGETAVDELAATLALLPLHSLSLDGDWEHEWQDCAPQALELASGLAGHPTLQRLWLRYLQSEEASEEAGQSKSLQLLETLLGNAPPGLAALGVTGAAFEHLDDFRSALLAALTRGGAPRLRHLSLPAACLRALTAENVLAAAPALRSLQLLRCGEGGTSWTKEADLLDTCSNR